MNFRLATQTVLSIQVLVCKFLRPRLGLWSVCWNQCFNLRTPQIFYWWRTIFKKETCTQWWCTKMCIKQKFTLCKRVISNESIADIHVMFKQKLGSGFKEWHAGSSPEATRRTRTCQTRRQDGKLTSINRRHHFLYFKIMLEAVLCNPVGYVQRNYICHDTKNHNQGWFFFRFKSVAHFSSRWESHTCRLRPRLKLNAQN